MKRLFDGFTSALAYFTILPLGSLARHAAPTPLTVAFLPFAGGLIGAAAGTIAFAVGLREHAWAPIVAWIACIVFSGAIHVDGFLDCCDALFAPVPAQRRLEILHDPRHGTFALTGMAILTVVWIAAISRIPLAHLALVLAFTGILSRIAAVANTFAFQYARPAVTAAFTARPNLAVLAIALAIACALGWLIDPLVFAFVPFAIALALLLGVWASRKLGGLTGDVLGAVVVVIEVLLLIAVGSI